MIFTMEFIIYKMHKGLFREEDNQWVLPGVQDMYNGSQPSQKPSKSSCMIEANRLLGAKRPAKEQSTGISLIQNFELLLNVATSADHETMAGDFVGWPYTVHGPVCLNRNH